MHEVWRVSDPSGVTERVKPEFCDHPEIALRAEHIRAPSPTKVATVFLFCSMCGTQGAPSLLGRPVSKPPTARSWPEAFIAGPWDLTK